MLKLFGAGAGDHPMRNPKEAKRILEALPPDDLKALDELAHWHESVSAAEGFKPPERAGLLTAIDEAAQLRLRKASREYCGATRPSRYQENRLWTHLHEYYRQAGLAFGRVIDATVQAPKSLEPKLQALLIARATRSLAQQIKWQHMRYGPVDPSVWGVLNNLFAFGEARGLADTKVQVYPAAGAETTPRQEFLRALMFSASAPDSLLTAEVDLAERVIAELVPQCQFAATDEQGLIFWTDLKRPAPPQRAIKLPQASQGLRYFGPGPALASLQQIMQKVEQTRDLPSSLGTTQDPEAALDLLRHLSALWAPEPPERRHARHSVKSRLTIAHGLAGVLEALGEGGSLDFDQKAAESWVVENVSAGGFGAVVPQVKGDWLKVGTLLAMQPDGGTNWVVGVVRRVSRVTPQEARVGIETLSRSPKAVRFRVRGLGEELGILLPAAVLGTGEAFIALRAGVYPPGQNLEATFDEREHVYMPAGGSQKGHEHELLRFREMIRDG
jgi:hypothetical protein